MLNRIAKLNTLLIVILVIVGLSVSGVISTLFMMLVFGSIPGTELAIPPVVSAVALSLCGVIAIYYMLKGRIPIKNLSKTTLPTRLKSMPKKRYSGN